MKDEPLEPRVTALEREAASTREIAEDAHANAATARAVASAASREVGEVRQELRAHTTVLNALRETQLEQGQKIDKLRQDFDFFRIEIREFQLETRVFQADMRDFQVEMRDFQVEMRDFQQETRQGFATMAAGMQHITTLLTRPGEGSTGSGPGSPS
ncbi:MAG TPA: hypothetical protein VM677_31935 [Actinokineospora sp.]|nr:hypothetical protein [Actinokineospora sp.]